MNVNLIAEIWLFPGITKEEGAIVKLPVPSAPSQNLPPRLMLSKLKALPPAPPFVAFQVTWMLLTVIVSCGFVKDKLITSLMMMSGPVVMLSHPGMAVGVMVGVKVKVGVAVSVGVKVTVGVDVIVGISVGVFVGNGVIVITSPENVAVGVLVPVIVSVGRTVPGKVVRVTVGVFVIPELEDGESRSR